MTILCGSKSSLAFFGVCSFGCAHFFNAGKEECKMKAIGSVKKVDKLGRIVIPKEIREFYNINTDDLVEIIGTLNGILIRKPDYKVIKKK